MGKGVSAPEKGCVSVERTNTPLSISTQLTVCNETLAPTIQSENKELECTSVMTGHYCM